MVKKSDKIKVIISGGGTGGHIFPAIAIADEIKRQHSSVQIKFVGANDRMEMERVPAAGYEIVGLPIMGLKRSLTFQNVKVIINLLKSLRMAKKFIKQFKPDVAIGVGGYASGPTLRMASKLNIPTLIQEQNSYAGITNRLLAKSADCICVAYKGMEKYFPQEKIKLTGNPVRAFAISDELKAEAFEHFEIKQGKPVLLIVGGSLGAKTINESIFHEFQKILESGVQLIWQTGKHYFDEIKKQTNKYGISDEVKIMPFISRMDLAYNIADLIISRAGAISISEICLMGKPSILVPSPNVSEDHQTKNAEALVHENAAIMVEDDKARQKLADQAISLIKDKTQLDRMSASAKQLAKPDAVKQIVENVNKLLRLN